MTSAIAANLETCADPVCAQPAEGEWKYGLVDEDGYIFKIVPMGYCLRHLMRLGEE